MGIDPGKNGGIAILEGEIGHVDLIHVLPYTDLEMLRTADILNGEDCMAVVEKVGAMPGQGVTSMFNFGQGFGYIRGVLEAKRIPYELVPPQKWKKEFSVTSDKNSSIEVCKRLFPMVNLKRTERCTKDHDGMAEALLMAEYARRHMK